MLRSVLWRLLVLSIAAYAPLPGQQPTARDTTLVRRGRVALDSADGWRLGQQPVWLKRQWAVMRAMYDSLLAPVNVTPPPPVNKPPVASFEAVCVDVTRICGVNAGASTDDKGISSYVWLWGDGSASSGVTASHPYLQAGTFTIQLTTRDAEGLSSATTRVITLTAPQPPPDTTTPPPDTTAGFAIKPELPRATPPATAPAPTRSYVVAGNLQLALDTARAGDEIRLTGTHIGNFTFRSCGAGWVTLTSANGVPAAGTRVTPTLAAPLAKIITTNFEAALRTTGALCRWRLVGLEIAATNDGTGVNDLGYGILRFGDYGTEQNTLAQMPHQIIIDRVYLHGSPNHNNTRCLVMNSGSTAVVNSWISECHARGADAQAIETWNGSGPFLIENNHLAGSGENVMFGGADPAIPNLSPSDITIRRNHFWKDPAWKGKWTVKNLFELKHAKRVLVEGNVFENNWFDAQSGMAIVIKSLSDNETAPWTQSADVWFRYNIVRNAPRGFNVQGKDGNVATPVARVRAEHNLFENIGAEGSGWLNQITHTPSDIAVVRNTFRHSPTVSGYGLALVQDYGNGAARRLEMTDNIFTDPAGYAVFYSGSPVGTAAFNAMWGTSWRATGNVFANVAGDLIGMHPPGNLYPAVITFAPDGSVPAYPNKGADIAEVLRRTAGAVVP